MGLRLLQHKHSFAANHYQNFIARSKTEGLARFPWNYNLML